MSDFILKVYFCGEHHQKQENKIHLFVLESQYLWDYTFLFQRVFFRGDLISEISNIFIIE